MAENLKDCSVPCKMSWEELEALCRRERLHCKELGVNRANANEYEVEFLCDYKKSKEEEFYLVKWRGFPESDNTWEPKRNLRCPKLMKQFHLDLDQELRRHKRRCIPKKLDKELTSVLIQKAKLRQCLQRWEAHLNHTRNHPGRIFVMNEVDLEGPPKNFTYINNYKVGQGIVLDEMAVGCECKNCLDEPVNGCCPGASFHRMAYNNRGQVRIRAGQPIYECNSRCNCGLDCPNRVVQKGIQFDLCIFKTENGRGWGVRTLQHIKKNTFVMEYVGEHWFCPSCLVSSRSSQQMKQRGGVTYTTAKALHTCLTWTTWRTCIQWMLLISATSPTLSTTAVTPTFRSSTCSLTTSMRDSRESLCFQHGPFVQERSSPSTTKCKLILSTQKAPKWTPVSV
ncbi:histone-lysine N-methyltransferase SUV39H1 isoform X4 [Seriola lalandi dorsalis]|uniref:histone-lysine N-methyltransferase SUV39H1 isoform X4 n=1 Tax=Seriola lalandi dorsalis TaxID=1841481 RepID=UPI000C6F71F4|nr:histone-lysine N-methyltransferase SUV39H1 isoform X4 [Seriola lalandi dorsalis]